MATHEDTREVTYPGATPEERQAWDRYAAGALACSENGTIEGAAKQADIMLLERKLRFK